MKYIDPIPPIRSYLSSYLSMRIYGNRFPSNPSLPALLVRSMGGSGAYRIQLLCRSTTDISAMQGLIEAMNMLENEAQNIRGLNILWAERESNPIHDIDDDTQKPEAWCYIRIEALQV